MDLAAEAIHEILSYDNGDWTLEGIYLWCSPHCKCGRTLEAAKEKTQAAMSLCYHSVAVVCWH